MKMVCAYVRIHHLRSEGLTILWGLVDGVIKGQDTMGVTTQNTPPHLIISKQPQSWSIVEVVIGYVEVIGACLDHSCGLCGGNLFWGKGGL